MIMITYNVNRQVFVGTYLKLMIGCIFVCVYALTSFCHMNFRAVISSHIHICIQVGRSD